MYFVSGDATEHSNGALLDGPVRTFGVECPSARFDSKIVVRRSNPTVDGGRSVETSLVERLAMKARINRCL